MASWTSAVKGIAAPVKPSPNKGVIPQMAPTSEKKTSPSMINPPMGGATNLIGQPGRVGEPTNLIGQPGTNYSPTNAVFRFDVDNKAVTNYAGQPSQNNTAIPRIGRGPLPSIQRVQEHQKNPYAGMAAQPLPPFIPQVAPGMSYDDALGRANAQLDPSFGRAVEGVKSQQRADTLNAGQIASNRGGAHSGLAADQINKVGIAAANNIANLHAERASTAAQMAQAMVDRSEDRADRLRQQQFNEWLGQGQLGLQRDRFGWEQSTDQRDFNRLTGLDAVEDARWNKTFDANEEQRKWGNRFNYGVARGEFGNGQQTLAMRQYLSGEDQRKLDNQYRDDQFGWQQSTDQRDYDYKVSQDKLAQDNWMKTFDEQVRQYGLDNALQWATENRLEANAKASEKTRVASAEQVKQLVQNFQFTGQDSKGKRYKYTPAKGTPARVTWVQDTVDSLVSAGYDDATIEQVLRASGITKQEEDMIFSGGSGSGK